MIPPTGHKLFLSDFIKSASISETRGYLFNSGSAALCFAVKNLSIQPNSKIVVPAYTCPTVASAIINAGHQPLLCDIAANTLNYDLNMLESILSDENPAAIIAVSLFGISSPIPESHIPVIMDNAQVNPIKPIKHQRIAEIYSFGRGKPINALAGGLLRVNKQEWFKNIDEKYASVLTSGLLHQVRYMMKGVGYITFFHPNRYGIPLKIPWLKLGETVYNPSIKIRRINNANIKCVGNILNRFEELSVMRKKISQQYKELIRTYSEHIKYYNKDEFYRFPILFNKEDDKNTVTQILYSRGIIASGMYPYPLNRQPILDKILNDFRSYPTAEFVSRHLLTLPVNEYVDDRTINTIDDVFNKVLRV